MNLYPAIDLFEGEVVRLTRGDYAQKTVYSKNPVEIAKQWESQGAKWLHIVDLEGAKSGEVRNQKALEAIRKAVKCRLQFGGGMRSLKVIESVIQLGVDRVVVGTKALDQKFLGEALAKFTAKIAVGLDTRNGLVQTQGWLASEGVTIEKALTELNHFALETIIYTDIQKDGMLSGPDFEGLNKVLSLTKSRVILSGGIAGIEDIQKGSQIKAKNFEGIIIGKALYDKKINLNEALSLT